METTVTRACGTCTECCVTYEVPAVKKSENVPCRHLKSSGCGIHWRRPSMCRAFRCLWLEGFGEESDRPDRSGRILSRYRGIQDGYAILQIACSEGYRIEPAEAKELLTKFMAKYGFQMARASVTYTDGTSYAVVS